MAVYENERDMLHSEGNFAEEKSVGLDVTLPRTRKKD